MIKINKKIIAIALVVLVIAVIGYFYFVGQDFKNKLIYKQEAEGTLQISAFPIMALAAYLTQNENYSAEQNQEFSNLCLSDYVGCIEKYAPNESLKTKCKKATIDIENLLSNVEKENSIILGYKITMGNLVCPTEDIWEEGIPLPLEKRDPNCLRGAGLDYGSSDAIGSTDACAQEFVKLYQQ